MCHQHSLSAIEKKRFSGCKDATYLDYQFAVLIDTGGNSQLIGVILVNTCWSGHNKFNCFGLAGCKGLE